MLRYISLLGHCQLCRQMRSAEWGMRNSEFGIKQTSPHFELTFRTPHSKGSVNEKNRTITNSFDSGAAVWLQPFGYRGGEATNLFPAP